MSVRAAVPLAAFAAVALAQPPAEAPLPRREPVLQQVKVPHPYYWREMYVPQATSGAASPAWSPDGTELVYAMQGSLWRQRVGSHEAVQLTDGPGYDHQPDWSPDGRHVAYASYVDDQVKLKLLDLVAGREATLVGDGTVNVDPRWSPDGRRLAWVSTAHQGRWHVFVAEVAPGGAAIGVPVRLTEDRDSGLPRYYYSRFDHYLSPAWSPDGRELILVSNRGRIHGTGGLWRMEARPGAPMREVHYEETTWKARPDWSPDARRVVYASYHGRQWHQLWLTTPEGGDPFPLTYGDFDATTPRWSRDGRRIAYTSNEEGDTSVWVVDVPGGRRQRLAHDGPGSRPKDPAAATLVVTVVDARTRQRVPARVSVTGSDGRAYAPARAWRHADEAFVRGEQRHEYTYFHGDGASSLRVPAGRTTIEVWRGPEHAVARHGVDVKAGATLEVEIALARLADLAAEGWRGADLHVHMNYGGAYRNTPVRLAHMARAEGLHAVFNLVVNKEQRIPDIAAFVPGPDPVSAPDLLVAHGQEFHTSVWGHLGLLGLREHFLLPDYAGYPGTAAASLAPTNTEVAEMARAQGALAGYVHPFDTPPEPEDRSQPLTFAAPVDAALGTLDYLEVMGYSDHLVTSEFWYRLLNCGFRIPAGAGTDAFPNFAALRGPVGLVRTYARVGEAGTQEAFLEALGAGRTVVTNAPLLWFAVEGSGPGDTVTRPAGTHRLRAHVRMVSAVPVDHLEVIGDGRVVARVPLPGDRMRAEATLDLERSTSGWYVLRAYADRPRLPVLDLYPFASTSPVYVEVGGRPARSAGDAAYFVRWVDRVAEAARAHPAWNTGAERDAVLVRLARARAEFESRARP